MAGAFPNADGQAIAQAMQQFIAQQAGLAVQPKVLPKPMPTVMVTGTPPADPVQLPLPPIPVQTQAVPLQAPVQGQALPEPVAPIESREIPPMAAAPAAAPSPGFQFPNVPQEALGGLLRTGLELMQPMPMWQTAAGHMARAAMSGVDYSNQQKVAEQQRMMDAAKLEQTKAQTSGVVASTEQTKASTGQTKATTEKILQELEDTKSMHGLRVDEMKAKIKQAQTSGVLNEAQAKALETKIENDPAYRSAVIEEMKARAYYYRNPQLRAGAAGGEPALVKTVEARTQALMSINKGMTEPEARALAWREVGMGAAGGKELSADMDAERTLAILDADYAEEKKANPKLTRNQFLRDWQANIMPGSAEEKIAVRVRELAMKGSGGAPTGGQAPAAAPSAPPIPSVMKNGVRTLDRSKLVPGQTYLLPNGQTYTHQGDSK